MEFKARDAFYDGERRLQEMERSGVDAEVVSPMPPLLDFTLPGPEGLTLARRVNDYIAELVREYPGRMLGMGMVPMQAPELAVAELDAIRDQGLVAIEITSNVLGRSLHEPEFEDFWSAVESAQMPVFIHGMPGDLAGRVPAGLVSVAGFAVGVDAALAATSIIAGGVAVKHPDLRVAFSHGAGGFPCMLGRANFFWGKTWNEEPSDSGEGISPAELSRRFWYDGLVLDRRTLGHLIEMMGHDKVLVGTDFPAMDRESPCARTLYSLDLPADVQQDITWFNTFRFLGIDPLQPVAEGAASSREGVVR
jgi:aminocarboxymuconate-semialdehyde decarboxylase